MAPLAPQVLATHGRLVAFAYAEAVLGPLFGKDEPGKRFEEALGTLALVQWHEPVHTAYVNARIAPGSTDQSALASTAAVFWSKIIAESDSAPPRVPHTDAIVSIARSRWMAATLV